MTGNGDETGRAGLESTAWTPGRMALLRQLIDETIAVIAGDPPADVPAAERRARAITSVARAIKAVDALAARPGRARPDIENPEDEMSDERDDDPQLVAELRAELAGRLDRLRAIIEQKSLDPGTRLGVGPAGDADAGAGAGPASGP